MNEPKRTPSPREIWQEARNQREDQKTKHVKLPLINEVSETSTSPALDYFERLQMAEITLLVRLPGAQFQRAIPMLIGEPFAEALRPLPRNREISWELAEREAADKQTVARQQAAKMIAEQLTRQLLSAFAVNDTTKGYSPEEWVKIDPEVRHLPADTVATDGHR